MLADTTLLITAYKRPDYLRRTLASWAACPEIGQVGHVVVALGQSHRWDDMTDVIRAAEPALGQPVRIERDSIEARESPGMHRALGEGIDRAFDPGVWGDPDMPEYVICAEEDVIVSSDALAFFGWSRHWYREGVLCVLAHNRGGTGWDGVAALREDQDADQARACLLPYFNPWVWMVSRGIWQSVMRPVWDWDCDSAGDQDSGYDWNLQRLVKAAGWMSLVPDAARSQTIGEHGGWASSPSIFPFQQSASFREVRENVQYRVSLREDG